MQPIGVAQHGLEVIVAPVTGLGGVKNPLSWYRVVWAWARRNRWTIVGLVIAVAAVSGIARIIALMGT